MDIGSDDGLAQHNLQIPAHASNRILPPYLFPRKFPKRSRLTSSRPGAILITFYHAKNPNPLNLLPPPPHIMCYPSGTAPHRNQRSYLRKTAPSTKCKPAARAFRLI
eukprot:1159259-Pelagomonas_calceolata.AAC.2